MYAQEEEFLGIDVSVFQGNINFNKVANNGIEVVYIQACSGTDFIDPNYESNYQGAKAAGLKIGFYQFITAANTTQAAEQAQFFYNLVKDKSIDCYLAMDFENFGNLSSAQVNEIATVYLQTLESLAGYPPVIYTDVNNAVNLWDEELAKYPLWIAQYGVKEPQSLGIFSSWVGFQYSDVEVYHMLCKKGIPYGIYQGNIIQRYLP